MGYAQYAPPPPRVDGNRLTIAKNAPPQLPWMCVKCGRPHHPQAPLTWRTIDFRWFPAWTNVFILVGLLPALVIQMILTKHARITLPCCASCDSRWGMTRLFSALSFLVPVLLCVGGLAIGVNAPASDRGSWILGSLVGLILSIIVVPLTTRAVFIAPRTVRTDFIDDYVIRLHGISPAFLAMFRAPPPGIGVGPR